MRNHQQILFNLIILLNLNVISAKFEKCSKKESDAVVVQIKENIDVGVKPCDDFHKYSCGNWYSRKSEDTLKDMEYKMKSRLRAFLESDVENVSTNINRTVAIYKACLLSSSVAKNEAMVEVLRNISDWPILNEIWVPNSFDWIKVIANFRFYGVQALIQEVIIPNPSNSSKYIIILTQPKYEFITRRDLLSLSPSDSEQLFFYERAIKNIMLDLGVKVRKARIFSQQILAFERQMAGIMLEESELSIPKIQTLSALQLKLPKINFRAYFDILFFKVFDPTEVYVAANEDFIRKLEALIERTSMDILAKYLTFQFIYHYNIEVLENDWKTCLSELEAIAPELLVQILKVQPAYQNYDNSKNITLSVFNSLKENFKNALIGNAWLEPKTKEITLLKIDNIKAYTGDEIDTFDDIYRNVKFDAQNYYKIKLELGKLKTKRVHSKLFDSQNHIKPKSEPFNNLKANAYYKLSGNLIQIPMGLMQPPILLNHCFDASIFGSLGSVLGHELTHVFDYDGLGYDQNGNVESWASAKSIIGFGKRAQCFIDQYENGYLTVNENLADNVGLRLAYEAFEKLSLEGQQISTDNYELSNLSANQIFFISFAQLWCGKGSGGIQHSSHENRVNNAVRNFNKFSEAFGCGIGSKMNPMAKKCQLW